MDAHEVIVDLRQTIMKTLKDSLQEIANAVSPNVEVHVNWSLNDPIDIPKMPIEDSEPVKRVKRKAKTKPKGNILKAERKAFYMCNYWRKKKNESPLSFEDWKAHKQTEKDNPEKN
jgi:hypothetical protein